MPLAPCPATLQSQPCPTLPLPNIAKFRQILPNSANFCQFLLSLVIPPLLSGGGGENSSHVWKHRSSNPSGPLSCILLITTYSSRARVPLIIWCFGEWRHGCSTYHVSRLVGWLVHPSIHPSITKLFFEVFRSCPPMSDWGKCKRPCLLPQWSQLDKST